MRSQAARIADPRSPAHQLGKQLNLPPAYLLIHRVTLSTIGVLCQHGATVRLRDELEDWLPGFVPEEEVEVSDALVASPKAEVPLAKGAPAEEAVAEGPLAEEAVAEA
jgi:hypothetical protein